MNRSAVFIDRDGTLVHARHYPSRPEQLLLYDGIWSELEQLSNAGFALVLVTNQSGIARGLFTEADLAAMHSAVFERLSAHNVRFDGAYVCPHHQEGVVEEFAVECECRKPQPGMLLHAADELGLDLASSWMVGDILDDVEAGNRAGCRTILVDLGSEPPPAQPIRRPTHVAVDSRHAFQIVLRAKRADVSPKLDYVPPRWRMVAR